MNLEVCSGKTVSREFKLEAVRLVEERGMSQSQAARDLGIHVNVLRKSIADYNADANPAFPGRGKMRPDDAEVTRSKRELAKTKAERDIPRRAIAFLAKEPQ